MESPELDDSPPPSPVPTTFLSYPYPTVSSAGKRILVAYDGSDESKRALNLALSLFKKGDHVVLACIVPTPRTTKFVNITTSLIGSPPVELASVRPSASDYSALEKVQKTLLEVLDGEASAFAKQGISTACHVLQGDPKTRLKRLVEFHECDIVVMGRRRRGASQAPLSHSCSNSMVSSSDANVIVVK